MNLFLCDWCGCFEGSKWPRAAAEGAPYAYAGIEGLRFPGFRDPRIANIPNPSWRGLKGAYSLVVLITVPQFPKPLVPSPLQPTALEDSTVQAWFQSLGLVLWLQASPSCERVNCDWWR